MVSKNFESENTRAIVRVRSFPLWQPSFESLTVDNHLEGTEGREEGWRLRLSILPIFQTN
jgi:hypothetical protein